MIYNVTIFDIFLDNGKNLNVMERTLDFRTLLSEKDVYNVRFQEYIIE